MRSLASFEAFRGNDATKRMADQRAIKTTNFLEESCDVIIYVVAHWERKMFYAFEP
jgi:hypothetical protein